MKTSLLLSQRWISRSSKNKETMGQYCKSLFDSWERWRILISTRSPGSWKFNVEYIHKKALVAMCWIMVLWEGRDQDK